jgi:hypothetical protein
MQSAKLETGTEKLGSVLEALLPEIPIQNINERQDVVD